MSQHAKIQMLETRGVDWRLVFVISAADTCNKANGMLLAKSVALPIDIAARSCPTIWRHVRDGSWWNRARWFGIISIWLGAVRIAAIAADARFVMIRVV